MFGDEKRFGVDERTVRQGDAGLWAVRYPSDQWRAWQYWLRVAFEKRFFPDWLTVWSEWPPTTQEAADRVAAAISDLRDSKFGTEKSPIGGRPVPRRPSPWDGHIPKFVGSARDDA